MSKILGLDISSVSTGWAYINNGRFYGKDPSKEKYCGLIKTSSKDSLPKRLTLFRESLVEVYRQVYPDIIYIEDVHVINVRTAMMLSRFSGVALEAANSELGISPELVKVTMVRSKLGTQGSSKENAFDYLVNKFKLEKYEFSKHNDITDALALALYGHILNKEK